MVWMTFSLPSSYLIVPLVTNKIMYLIILDKYIHMIGTEITSMYILCIVQFLLYYFDSLLKSKTSINMYLSISKIIILIKDVKYLYYFQYANQFNANMFKCV